MLKDINATPPDIIKIRKKLEKLDKKILKAFKKRFDLLEKLAKIKLHRDFPIEDTEQEKKMLKKWKKIFKIPKGDPEFLDDLFDLVVDSSKKAQESYFKKH